MIHLHIPSVLALAANLATLTRGPRCAWCGEPHWFMGAHVQLDHADLETDA